VVPEGEFVLGVHRVAICTGDIGQLRELSGAAEALPLIGPAA
jgi:hypothetical protein